ncbi:MAG TPA: hypothetical protein VJ719_02355 [Chthoniobacterales bacterium]|nr:hypothetical protein [Chthoniobacterales bacterium]
MNDFSDLESQLKSLRPAPLRPDFISQVERAMNEPAAREEAPAGDKIVRPWQFRRHWAIGLGLAAAAALLLLVRPDFQPPRTETRVVTAPAEPANAHSPSVPQPLPNAFIPAGSTEVVYQKKDEGLIYANNSEQPVRRMRSVTQETLQWKNPATGASLRVSYPSEHVQLIPVSGQ